MRYVIILLFLSGCGSPILEPGKYEVQVQYANDAACEPADEHPGNQVGSLPDNCSNEWPLSNAGSISDAVWSISEDGGKYNMKVEGGSTDVNGRETGGTVVFAKDTLSECSVVSTFYTKLIPNKEGNKFSGWGVIWTAFCQGGGLLTEVNLTGTHR